jgi:hypothetical protein
MKSRSGRFAHGCEATANGVDNEPPKARQLLQECAIDASWLSTCRFLHDERASLEP